MPPESHPTAGSRATRVAVPLITLALLAGTLLRFTAPAALWLDEAQSVAIARLGLPGLFAALRQDGAPPLYYLLLHAWTALFGDSAPAVRALSGTLSVLALPVAWVLGRQVAGPRGGVALLLLLAGSPFAIRYASETRMYSLVVLLVLLGALAVRWAVLVPGPAPVAAVALSAAALLLTHYWSIHLLAVLGLLCLAGLRRHRPAARRVLLGLVLSAVPFLAWLPSFTWQLAHTGTPWAEAGGLSSLSTALGAWQGGGDVAPVLLGHVLVGLLALGLVSVPTSVPADAGVRAGVRLGWVPSWTRWSALALSAGTLLVAGLASLLTDSAVGARYSSVAFPAFLLLVAVGVAAVPERRMFTAVLAVPVLLGLGIAAAHARSPRTQAADVAAVLEQATPGDVVAFCPDQLAPAVSRLAPRGLDLVVYPDLGPADRVDWTDYARRNESADPAAVAAALVARAGEHEIWVVSGRGYLVPSDADCRDLRVALAALRGKPELVVARDPAVGEDMRMHRFAAP